MRDGTAFGTDFLFSSPKTVLWCIVNFSITRDRLYETWIAYSADKSWKRNSVIQALNNQTLILSAE